MTDWPVVVSNLLVGLAIWHATRKAPIEAVRLTLKDQKERRERDRRDEIFRALMAYRASFTQIQFVTHLNMVPIVFRKDDAVMRDFKAVMDTLNRDSPTIGKERVDAMTRLLTTIARSLDYPLDHLDVMNDLYVPNLWVETDEAQRKILEFQHSIAKWGHVPVGLAPGLLNGHHDDGLALKVAVVPAGANFAADAVPSKAT